MESEECEHRWKFKKGKHGGVTRRCTRCHVKITELAVVRGSSLDGDFKIIRPKGKHRPK
jgi:hypothetical protein